MSRGRVVTIVSAVVAGLFLGVSPAQASSGNIFHGNDMAYWNNTHTLLHTCDYELDGHRVRAWLQNTRGQQFVGVWAPSQGCAPNSIDDNYVWIRLCEEVVGCTEWKAM